MVLQTFLPDLSGNPLRAIPFVFAGGVLTSLTPCIYPMIPIALTLTYVFGLALVYSALGLFAGMTGTLFGSVSTNPWLYLAMANLLLLAALAMLDVVPVRFPAALVHRASNVGSAGRLSGAFAMGAMSGLVAAPCSAPVMARLMLPGVFKLKTTIGR